MNRLLTRYGRRLSIDAFPLYVAEGTSSEKLTRISTSDYLSRALRSLAAINGGLLCYGLSFSRNDKHIIDSVARSKISRLAVSLFGDPGNESNRETIRAVSELQNQRLGRSGGRRLDVKFFDAASVRLWH